MAMFQSPSRSTPAMSEPLAAAGLLRHSAVRVDEAHLRVPGPDLRANQRRFHRGQRPRRIGRGIDIGHLSFPQIGQRGLIRDDGFRDARRRNPAVAHRETEAKEQDHADQQQKSDLRSRLKPVSGGGCGDGRVVEHVWRSPPRWVLESYWLLAAGFWLKQLLLLASGFWLKLAPFARMPNLADPGQELVASSQ